MKFQDKLKVKMILEDGFKDGFMEYVNHYDRFEDARDDCLDYFLYKLRQNANLSPLVQLMLEYIEIKTDLKIPKIKLPPIDIKPKQYVEEDSESDSSSDTVIFNKEEWKLKRT